MNKYSERTADGYEVDLEHETEDGGKTVVLRMKMRDANEAGKWYQHLKRQMQRGAVDITIKFRELPKH